MRVESSRRKRPVAVVSPAQLMNTMNEGAPVKEPNIEIGILEIVDIEEHATKTNGGKPPKAHHYKIRVDREKFTVDVAEMTGRQILTLAGKTPPERYLLNQKFRHGRVLPIGLDQTVDFTAPGVERFTTLPKDQTEGLVACEQQLRRAFKLPEDDTVQLDIQGHKWETTAPNWLFIHDFPVPEGYTVPVVSVAIQISHGYPAAALDMAYFYPALRLLNGRHIPNTESSQSIDGKNWQRWSRHYSPQNPWISGEYNILTHLQLVFAWLERELSRN